jgi:DNA-binding NarL/FixJ family response regulator
MSSTWFITGASKGFGREWAEAALERGDNVAATARNLEALEAFVNTYGDAAAGDALLSPTVTKRVIKSFTRLPRPAPPKELDDLTERERDVFRLIASGRSNAEIAQELYVSDTTVKTHVTHIFQKLNLRDRVQLVVLAYQTGLLEADAGRPGSHD